MVFINKLFDMKIPQEKIKLNANNNGDIIGSDFLFLNEENKNNNNLLVNFMSYQNVNTFDNIIVPKFLTILNKKIVNTNYIKETKKKIPNLTNVLKKIRIHKNHNIMDFTTIQPEIISRLNTGSKIKISENLFNTFNKACIDFDNNITIRGSKLEAKERKTYLFIYNNINKGSIVDTTILEMIEYYFRLHNFNIETNLDGILYCINNKYFPLTFIENVNINSKVKSIYKNNLHFNRQMLTQIHTFIENFTINDINIKDTNNTNNDTNDSNNDSMDLNTLKVKIMEIVNDNTIPNKEIPIKELIQKTNDVNLLDLDFEEKVKYIFKDLYDDSKTTKDINVTVEDIDAKKLDKIKDEYKKVLETYHGSKTIKINNKDRVFKAEEIVGMTTLSGYDRQKQELKDNVDIKMIDLFKSLENDKDINIKIKDIKIGLVDEYNNRYKLYKARIEHPNFGKTFNKPYELQLKVPYTIEDKYIKINGNNYIMINQLFPKPLHKINQNLVRLYTHFNTGSFFIANSANSENSIQELENNTILNLKKLSSEKNSNITITTEHFTNEEKINYIDKYNFPKLSFMTFKYSKIKINKLDKSFLINLDDKTEFNDSILKNKYIVYLEKTGNNIEQYSYIEDNQIITVKDNEIHKEDLKFLDQFLFDKIHNISIVTLKKDLYKKSKSSTPTFMMSLPGIKNKSIFLYLIFILGFDNACKKLNIKYTNTDKRDTNATLSFKFKNGYLNLFADNKFKEMMINGLKLINKSLLSTYEFNATTITDSFVDKYYTKDLGYQAYKYRELANKFIDNSTKKALAEGNYKDNLIDLISSTIPEMLTNRNLKNTNEIDNYRLRMSETISNVAYEVLQRAVTNFKTKKENPNEKIDIDKNYIFTNLISAGILQETISINPLEELMLTMKVTKTGVGNARKNMITLERRDLNPSYFGIISPTATNEYGGIGSNQTLTNGFILQDYEGGISKKKFDNNSNSFENLSPVESLSPFFEYDDTTRRVMGNQQTGQFIQLDNPDEPLIQTGFESYIPQLVSDRFTKKAKKDGVITSIENRIIKIKYNDNTEDIINCNDIKSRTKRGIYIPTSYTILASLNQKIKKGDILAATSSLKSGKLAIGKNINIALLPYMGMNFEDGWVVTNTIGKKFKNKILKRIIIPISPDAKINDINISQNLVTKPGDLLISYMMDKYLEDIYNNVDIDDEEVFSGLVRKDKDTSYFSPGGVIKEVIVKINNLKTTPKEVKRLYNTITQPINEKIQVCELQAKDILDTKQKKESLFNCMGDTENINMLKIGNHKFQGKEYEGSIIEIYIETENPLMNGTKFTLANTGGKGTVQYIIPEGKEPRSTDTNMQIDFIPTSIGIIKRKNISIILMIYLGKTMYFLNEICKEMVNTNKDISIIEKTVMSVFSHLDKTKDNIVLKQLKEFFKNSPDYIKNLIRKSDSLNKPLFPAIVPPFKNKLKVSNIRDAANEIHVPLNEKVYIPELNITTETEVPVGILPIYLLEHFPKAMSSVRGSLFNKREFISNQGISGTKEKAGANKIGLYDINSLLTKQPYSLIKELHALKSDSNKARNQLMKSILKLEKGQLPDIDSIEVDREQDLPSKRWGEVLFYGAGLKPDL